MKDLSNYRKSYEKSELLENQIPEDPINLFHKWFFEAEDLNAADEVNAMTVSTIGLDGYPKSRVVLLKKFNEEGFIFYTNYNSEKGKAILNNPNVLLAETKYSGIVKTFNTLHYDAFANLNATIGYVYENGLSYGFQLLSALLFFVPRSIWVSKPLSTGQLIGEDLIDNYGFNFSNLSNPLVSEAYINFGYLGIFFFAVIFSYVLVKMLHWLKSENELKKIMSFYLAIHLLFLLRGDFTNGFSYYIGTLFGVLLIPKIVKVIVDEFLKLKGVVKN